MEEKLHTYGRKTALSRFYLFPKTLQDNSNVLSKRSEWRKQRVIPLRTKTPLDEKQSTYLTEREEEREKAGGGGKTRQRARGWLRREEERVLERMEGKEKTRRQSGPRDGERKKEGWENLSLHCFRTMDRALPFIVKGRTAAGMWNKRVKAKDTGKELEKNNKSKRINVNICNNCKFPQTPE